MKSEILSEKEIRLYAPQIELSQIGLQGQEKIKQAKVIVIGAGGKGTSVLQHLTSLGTGHIGITDNYLVEESCLTRQRLYGNGDLGKQKAIIAKQKLQEINHLVDFRLHNVCLSDSNILNICEEYDILVDATDNFSSRYLINDAAIALNKPLVFGSIVKSEVHVSVFNYKNGPSLRCLYAASPGKDKKSGTVINILSTGLLTGIAGVVMANEIVKIILGKETPLSGALFVFDINTYTSSLKPITKNAESFNITRFK
jgi:sulfur-carrier protein adenylyltransferase/sulfurtransferase